MGINKTSNREPRRRRRQESEYGMQLREKQKALAVTEAAVAAANAR